MFDIDILQSNPNVPTFYTALLTVIFSFFLSSLIAITYEFTNKGLHRNTHFIQSIALISIVASTIMLAIGDSLAVGLGMLGALSIIRFRTSINNPRNITFIFAALAAGIASGVLGFSIALTGTLVFCTVAFLLHFSSWGRMKDLIITLRLVYDSNFNHQNTIEKELKTFSSFYELTEIKKLNRKRRNKKGKKKQSIQEEAFYSVRIKDQQDIDKLVGGLQDKDIFMQIRYIIDKSSPRL